MAAPSFVLASSGQVVTTSGGTITLSDVSGNVQVGDFVVVHTIQKGTGAAPSLGTVAGIESLAGIGSTMGQLVSSQGVGGPQTALTDLWIGRATSSFISAQVTAGGTDDLYGRMYVFRDVNAGTTTSDVLEAGSAGSIATDQASISTIDHANVVTLGADRLCVCFVAVADDNALDAFTGTSGGTWSEAVAEYATSTGTDAALGLQTLTKATSGTVSGGTDTMAAADSWATIAFALIPTSSGTTHQESYGGSITPTGSLVKLAKKNVSGSVTPTGALAKLAKKLLGGSITPIGALTAARVVALAVAGAITPSGSLVNLAKKALAGSVAPTGSLEKLADKRLSGAITPTGALQKLVSKLLAGSVTPTGDLSTAHVVALALAGSITPAGAIQLLVDKRFAGAITPTGALAKLVTKLVEGSITPSGSLARTVLKGLSGSITPTGALTNLKAFAISLAGSITPTGTLVKTVTKRLAGAVTPTGSISFLVQKFLGGAITPSGVLDAVKQGAQGAAVRIWRTLRGVGR